MLRRILTTALAAGIVVGIAISGVQMFTTIPLIYEAEEYEQAGATAWHSPFAPVVLVLVHGEEEHETATAGWERPLLTLATNVLTGVGFALLLVAAFVFAGQEVTGRTGAVWGVAGFAVFTLAPAFGLPPELPATAAADLAPRQLWWLLAAASTAAGLWLLVLRRETPTKIVGVASLFLPHIVGAPHPAELTHLVPPELAARFSASAIVVSALFWVSLGWTAGTLYDRLGRRGSGTAAATR